MSLGADAAGVSPVPMQMWAGVSPVLAQMWAGASAVLAQRLKDVWPLLAQVVSERERLLRIPKGVVQRCMRAAWLAAAMGPPPPPPRWDWVGVWTTQSGRWYARY